jgi:hypothetical protein
MALWKKLWVLFTVMWLVVAGLNVMTILVFSDEVEHGKALTPIAFGILVPAALYAVGALWEFFTGRRRRRRGR